MNGQPIEALAHKKRFILREKNPEISKKITLGWRWG